MLNAKCKRQNAKAERLHVSPLLHFDFCILNYVVALLVVATSVGAAQIGGKLVVGGNPTPGTEQPEPPNLADRITASGCLQAAPKNAATNDAPDANTPSDTRFVLANAELVGRVPAGTGGSPAAASATSRSYRLSGIESQFSPFMNTKVEISGEIKPVPPSGSDANGTPTLVVEFVQKLASTCK